MQPPGWGQALWAAAAVPTTVRAARFSSTLRYLRPPGALAAEDFLARCINCGQFGEICPNRCIKYFGLETVLGSLDTPHNIPRQNGCTLCRDVRDESRSAAPSLLVLPSVTS